MSDTTYFLLIAQRGLKDGRENRCKPPMDEQDWRHYLDGWRLGQKEFYEQLAAGALRPMAHGGANAE